MTADSKQSRERISPAQFEALAALLSMQPGPSMVAARAVLVDGARGVDAAGQAGMGRSGVSNAVARMTRTLALARRAAGLPDAAAPEPLPDAVLAVPVDFARAYTREEAAALTARGFRLTETTTVSDDGARFALTRQPADGDH